MPEAGAFTKLLIQLCTRQQLPVEGETEQLQDNLFQHYCHMLQQQARQRPQCGIWLQPSSVSHQLRPLADELLESGEVDVLVIISVADAAENPEWLQQQCWSGYPLLICHDSQFGQLTQLQLLFMQESAFCAGHSWPRQLIKLGLPHGVDIPLKKTLTEYGGCLEFDYVLSARPQAEMPTDSFVDRYPEKLRMHSRPFVAEIPFGFVKYDDFYRRRTACAVADTALIYHISNLALEWPWVQQELLGTISLLMEHFPDYNLVFRPFPADLEHPAVQACRLAFAKERRFIFSDAPSYADDYSAGALMICHRFYKEHLFPLVTGRPQIVYQPAEPRDADTGIVTNVDNLLARVAAELAAIRMDSPGKQMATDVYHPGAAVRYLLDNLTYILTDSKHPDWRYFALDCNSDVDRVLQQAEAGALAFNKLALAAVLQAPERMDYQLLALESLIRVPAQLHSSPLSLLYWRKAMAHAAQLLRDLVAQEQLPRALDCWMYQRGLLVLRQMLVLMQSLSLGLNDDEQLLLSYYRPAEFRDWPTVRQFVVVATNGAEELAGGEVILYGAGQLAVEFIAEQLISARFKVVAIVDSAESKWQQQLAGVMIQSPDMLANSSQPVVICSRAFAEEIRARLLELPDLQRRLYRLL